MSSYGSEIGSSLRNALIHKLLLYVAGFATLNMLTIQSNKAPQRVKVRLERVGHTPHLHPGCRDSCPTWNQMSTIFFRNQTMLFLGLNLMLTTCFKRLCGRKVWRYGYPWVCIRRPEAWQSSISIWRPGWEHVVLSFGDFSLIIVHVVYSLWWCHRCFHVVYSLAT